ncbi:aldose epimerase family protein [Lachnoclostridium edouardi]|uniref:aldose epimerase family protein n=1 Tax=Lachnoclostridium edouardi TaxID=1926283 RepID=UPI000C7DFACA|nr:aldose epimerase family protein [Lachnoclostridium edouardi]
MACRKVLFGMLPDGRQVNQYILVNARGTEAAFLDLGAIWNTMKVADAAGNTADVVLGYDKPEYYLQDGAYFGSIIGRNANRIGGAGFQLNGTTYSLAFNDGNNNLHSGPDLYRNRIWETEVEETEEETTLIFSLWSEDMDQGYPGRARIEVRYTLTEDDCIKIQYHMVCNKDTIANFTNHSYFNLAGHNSGSAMDQEVWINAVRFTPADQGSIPTGEIQSVKGTPMDFTEYKVIGHEIDDNYEQLVWGNGYDHNWVLNDYGNGLRLAAKARDKKSGRVLETYTDLPGIQFYAGNYLDGKLPGKDGAAYGKRHGYCFETQYYPDAIHHMNFPSPILKAGEEYKTTTIYRFLTEKQQ